MTFPAQRAWRPDEDAFLRDRFYSMPRAELAAALGRTVPAVNQRASVIKARRSAEPRWTAADVEALKALFHVETQPVIAARLGRSVVGVKIKARRLGLRRRRRRALSLSQVARAMLVDRDTARRWVRLGWLPAHRAPTPEREILHVWREDLVEFLQAHPEAWDSRKCPRLLVTLGVLAKRPDGGYEPVPIWFEGKLHRDFRRGRRGKRWTPGEDSTLMGMVRQGQPYRAIAERMGRTYYAVDHRACRLGRRVWQIKRGA